MMVRGLAHTALVALLLMPITSSALAQEGPADVSGEVPAAESPPRVVVDAVAGPTKLARKVRLAVVRALLERSTVIPVAELERARADLASGSAARDGAGAMEEDARFAAIARAITADGVVVGAITGRGGRRSIELVIRSGWDGAIAATRSIPLPRRFIGKKQQDLIAAAVVELLEELQAAARERARRQAAAASPSPGTSSGAASGPASEPASGLQAGSPARPFWRDIHGSAALGWSFLSRTLDFSVADSVPDAMRPFQYEALASGLTLDVEVYPLGALGDVLGGHLVPLGVRFAFDRSIGLRSESAESPGETFGTVRQHISLGLVYARTFHLGRPIEIIGGLGFDRLSHSIALDDVAIELPDVAYSSLDLGLRVRVPVLGGPRFGAPLIAAYLDTSLLLGLGAGDIEAMDSYGESSVTGLDLDLGAEIAPLSSWPVPAALRVRLGLRYIRVGLGFDGSGALTELDGDGETDVDGASDSYLGGYLAAGYVF